MTASVLYRVREEYEKMRLSPGILVIDDAPAL